MRIALDLTPLAGPFPISIVRIVRPLVAALHARSDVELVRLQPAPEAVRGRFQRAWTWRQRALPRLARSARADLLHVFGSAFPLTAALPVVQTVHELPWLRGARENAGGEHRAWIAAGRRFARATCVPSAATAADLGVCATEANPGAPLSAAPNGVAEPPRKPLHGGARHGGEPAPCRVPRSTALPDPLLWRRLLAPHPRVHVVPWGVGEEFLRPVDAAALPPSLPRGPFVLAPGATRPKKRVELVWAGAALAGVPVVVTGAHDAAFAERAASSAAEVVLLGEVPDAVLPALFERAAAVALLAASEGFALPVLEAFARGTPVVVPRGSVQAVTADGLALEVDAEDPASVAEGIARALGRDFDADALCANAAARTWDATAARLVEVWGALL